MNQVNLAYPILIKSSSHLFILIIILFFYIRFFPDKVDCPFFYSERDRITTKFFIFLLTMVVFFLLTKSFLDLEKLSPGNLINSRRSKFENMGVFKN